MPVDYSSDQKIYGYEQEKKVIHLLVSKGTYNMLDADLDEEEVVPVAIANWFVDELEEDHIEFLNPIYARMYNLLADQIEQERIPSRDWWVRPEDQDIVKEVTDALTDKYTLANWKSKDIYLPEEEKTIFTLVRETTMRMKYVHVERKLHALKDYLKMEGADYDYYMVQFQKWNSARQMINEN